MNTVATQDLVPVRSRVSWPAILAGAVTALAVYLLLNTLGIALGLSVSNQLAGHQLGVGAALWAVAVTLFSLFLGGVVASQCTVGETKDEAVIYGVVLWGVVFAALLWLMASGVRIGFSAVMGMASTSPVPAVVVRPSIEDLRKAGFPEEEIERWRVQLGRMQERNGNVLAEMREASENPRTIVAAWWTFAGVALSMLASIMGALAGSGPALILSSLNVRTAIVQRTTSTHEPAVR